MPDDRIPPTTVRFSEDELKIVEAARNLEDENLSQFIRRVVMDAAMALVAKNAVR